MKRLLLILAVLVTALTVGVGSAQATPPPVGLKVYDNTSGGTQIGFWLKHGTGWSWHSTNATAEKRLGCSITAYAWDTQVPSILHVVAWTVKPTTANPYHVSHGVIFFVQSITRQTKATCTLRHKRADGTWLYKTVTASWNGT